MEGEKREECFYSVPTAAKKKSLEVKFNQKISFKHQFIVGFIQHSTLKFFNLASKIFNAQIKRYVLSADLRPPINFTAEQMQLGLRPASHCLTATMGIRLCQATNIVSLNFSLHIVFFGSILLARQKGFDFLCVCSHRSKKRRCSRRVLVG